jgi:hypothetical protein
MLKLVSVVDALAAGITRRECERAGESQRGHGRRLTGPPSLAPVVTRAPHADSSAAVNQCSSSGSVVISASTTEGGAPAVLNSAALPSVHRSAWAGVSAAHL